MGRSEEAAEASVDRVKSSEIRVQAAVAELLMGS